MVSIWLGEAARYHEESVMRGSTTTVSDLKYCGMTALGWVGTTVPLVNCNAAVSMSGPQIKNCGVMFRNVPSLEVCVAIRLRAMVMPLRSMPAAGARFLCADENSALPSDMSGLPVRIA